MPRFVTVSMIVFGGLTTGPALAPAGQIARASQDQVRRWLEQYPEADTNRDGRLTVEEAEKPDAYRVAHGALGDASQWIDYAIQVDQPTAICGPIVLTLWATLTTLDTDFFVLLADRDPEGHLYGLQRGLLRASHRDLDPMKSEYVTQDGRKLLIRPWHPHAKAEPVTPHEPCQYEIEIPAVGHVFRPGHTLVLRLSRPPEADPIGVTRSGAPSYRYDSDPPPGVVQILHDARHPSSLLLPVLAELPPLAEAPPPLARQAGLKIVP